VLYFFISYARGNEDDLVRKFCTDLSIEVRVLAGLPRDAEVGFIDAEMSPGTRWSRRLVDALSTCRSFIALMSPRYFQSQPCGQEWQIFAERSMRYERATGRDPSLLKPLFWVPVPPGKMHPAALRIQFADQEDDTCLRQMMRLKRHEDAYKEFLFNLASQIVDAADQHAIPTGVTYSDLESVPNVFHQAPAIINGIPVNELIDATTVHFVVAAPTRDEATAIRAELATYGDRRRDWAPYHPAWPDPLTDYAISIAASRNFLTRVADLEELGERAAIASQQNHIVVLLVDAWITRLLNPLDLLTAYGGRPGAPRNPTTVVLAPASDGDGETRDHWPALSETWLATASHLAPAADLSRWGIATYHDFARDLPSALEVAMNRVFASGDVRRQPLTTFHIERPTLEHP
jgi:FxsC-like protein